MRRKSRLVLAGIFTLLTIVFLALTIYRMTWDYNEQGIHFDADSMTTYNESAVLAYGVLAVMSLVPTIAFLKSWLKGPGPH